MCMLSYSVAWSCRILCDPMEFRPPGSSVHGISPGKITGVGCHFLLQRNLPDPRIKLSTLASPVLVGRFFTPGKPKLGLSDLKNGLKSSWCTYISSKFNSLKENLLPSLMWVCTNDSRAEWRQKVILGQKHKWQSWTQPLKGMIQKGVWEHEGGIGNMRVGSLYPQSANLESDEGTSREQVRIYTCTQLIIQFLKH